jgi:lipopolysaccharide export system protein LptA
MLTAKRVLIDEQRGIISAQGDVNIVTGSQIWRAEKVDWNYKEQKIEAENARGGTPPFFFKGSFVEADYQIGFIL